MEKPAPTSHPIHTLLRRRWSPRAFDSRPVPAKTLRSILEAARWAPSSFNEQPWRFVLARRAESPELHQTVLETLSEGNQRWADQAPVLIIAAARTTFSRNDRANRHAAHDVGQALAHLTVEAMARDVFVHQMAGFDREAARERLSIPEGFEPMTAVALGFAGDPDELPEELAEREHASRSRRPLQETVFGDSWGQPAPLVEPSPE